MANQTVNLPTKTKNSTPLSTNSQTIRLSDSQATAPAEISLEHIAPARRRVWTSVLSGAYAFLGRELPSGNRLKFTIRTFDDLCSEIPTELLEDVYRLSMLFPDFWDGRLLLRAWKENEGSLREKLSAGLLVAKPRPNCPDCFGNSTGRKYDARKRLTPEICMHENDPGDDDEEITEDIFQGEKKLAEFEEVPANV